MKKTLLTTCFLAVLALPAFAAGDFINGGFETNSTNTPTGPTGWTLHSGLWGNWASSSIPDGYQGLSTVISGTSLTDPITDLNTNGNLREVLSGTNSYRLNDESNGCHFSTLSHLVFTITPKT